MYKYFYFGSGRELVDFLENNKINPHDILVIRNNWMIYMYD